MEHMERPSSVAQDVDAKATAMPLTFEELFAYQHKRLYRACGARKLRLAPQPADP
jgi:hypothetical protein